MFSRLVLIALIAMPVAAREYTVKPRLYRAVYVNNAGIDEKELVRELPSFRTKTPFTSDALSPLARNLILEIRKFNAVARPEFKCDLDSILFGTCQAREMVIYQMIGGGKTADTIAGRSLAPLAQWDITKRYSLLPIRTGYRCSIAALRYQGKWQLDPPAVTCSAERAKPWIIETDIKPPSDLIEEEQNGLVARLTAAVDDAIEENGDRLFVAHEKEQARRISSISLEGQIAAATTVHYVLELVVVR